jgi:hypothetical protein
VFTIYAIANPKEGGRRKRKRFDKKAAVAQCVIFPKTVHFRVTSVARVTRVTTVTSWRKNVSGQKEGK